MVLVDSGNRPGRRPAGSGQAQNNPPGTTKGSTKGTTKGEDTAQAIAPPSPPPSHPRPSRPSPSSGPNPTGSSTSRTTSASSTHPSSPPPTSPAWPRWARDAPGRSGPHQEIHRAFRRRAHQARLYRVAHGPPVRRSRFQGDGGSDQPVASPSAQPRDPRPTPSSASGMSRSWFRSPPPSSRDTSTPVPSTWSCSVARFGRRGPHPDRAHQRPRPARDRQAPRGGGFDKRHRWRKTLPRRHQPGYPHRAGGFWISGPESRRFLADQSGECSKPWHPPDGHRQPPSAQCRVHRRCLPGPHRQDRQARRPRAGAAGPWA